jgi:hypothetical protein
MPHRHFLKDWPLILAGVSAAASAWLFIYGQWKWIIQSGSDTYGHWSALMALFAVLLFFIGMSRRKT